MKWMTTKLSVDRRMVGMLWLTAIVLMMSGALLARSNDDSQKDPVGTWLMQITLRDCTSGAPLGPPFNALTTFHQGGTVSDSSGSLTFAIGQRSEGHGNWSRQRFHTYSQRMVSLVLFDTEPNLPGTPGFDPQKPISPGFFAGWGTVSHNGKLTDADHLMSSGTNAFYKSNGELYRTGCSTAVGQRFQ